MVDGYIGWLTGIQDDVRWDNELDRERVANLLAMLKELRALREEVKRVGTENVELQNRVDELEGEMGLN